MCDLTKLPAKDEGARVYTKNELHDCVVREIIPIIIPDPNTGNFLTESGCFVFRVQLDNGKMRLFSGGRILPADFEGVPDTVPQDWAQGIVILAGVPKQGQDDLEEDDSDDDSDDDG